MNQKDKIRESEIKDLIDEIFQDNFLKNTLGFKEFIKIDKDKLIMSGHSMGGGTAVRISKEDKRIKCLVTLDPWIFPQHKEIDAGEFDNF